MKQLLRICIAPLELGAKEENIRAGFSQDIEEKLFQIPANIS